MKWTVLFIVHGLGDGLQEQSRVLTNVVGYGNWRLNHTNLLFLKSDMGVGSKKKLITSDLYKVNPLKAKRSGEPDITRLRRFKNINIGNKYRLSAVFSYVRQHFPSEKLMIVFFDHGAGFGIFEPIPEGRKFNFKGNMDEVDEALKDSKNHRTRNLIVPPKAVERTIRDIAKGKSNLRPEDIENPVERLRFFRKKFSHTDMLTMEELSGAIRRGFRRKVDVMIMVNCNMQMIETGFSLRNDVHYLVGSETMFWIYGINYREILFRIDRILNIPTRYVADKCIETLPFRYERINKEKNLNEVGFAAVDLEKMKPVYQKLNSLAGKLTEGIKQNFAMIRKARNAGIELSQYNLPKDQTDGYEPSFFYDLLFFLKNLKGHEKEVKEIEALLRKAIVNSYIGSDFKKGKKELVNGVSVFLPFKKDDFDMQYFNLFYKKGARFRIDFAGTAWGKFLYAIKKEAER